MRKSNYESPVQNLLETLGTSFANTVNPKGSLEIEQMVVDDFMGQLTKPVITEYHLEEIRHNLAMAIHVLTQPLKTRSQKASHWIEKAQKIINKDI